MHALKNNYNCLFQGDNSVVFDVLFVVALIINHIAKEERKRACHFTLYVFFLFILICFF